MRAVLTRRRVFLGGPRASIFFRKIFCWLAAIQSLFSFVHSCSLILTSSGPSRHESTSGSSANSSSVTMGSSSPLGGRLGRLLLGRRRGVTRRPRLRVEGGAGLVEGLVDGFVQVPLVRKVVQSLDGLRVAFLLRLVPRDRDHVRIVEMHLHLLLQRILVRLPLLVVRQLPRRRRLAAA
ncbi:hypothetical protein VTK73DRAFT_4537 [Phialemonium thermophilum]|uniref:Secreted protein n=1 Tax=Phialemonium thermophilum TaxID=223376 RepID=A0ABR3V7P7_9PEZI